jgi:hypothetical protein
MPEAAHRGLVKSAQKKHLTGKAFERYVYGRLANLEKKKRRKKERGKGRIAKP